MSEPIRLPDSRVFEPSTCILHATVHHMTTACWSAMLDWYLANVAHLEGPARLHAYQAAAERRMLDEIRLVSAVDHAVPAPIDRAIRRDHSLCGAEPCSDCR